MKATVWWREFGGLGSTSTPYKILRVILGLPSRSTFSKEAEPRLVKKKLPRKMVGLLLISRELPSAINTARATTCSVNTNQLCVISKKAVIWSVRYYRRDASYCVSHNLVRSSLLHSVIAGCISVLKSCLFQASYPESHFTRVTCLTLAC